MSIAISSGHGLKIRGASGIIDEVDEARRVVDWLAHELALLGCEVHKFHDDISTTQSENLERIADWHNAQDRELDVSVHFNAYVETDNPMGTECLYVSQQSLAADVAAAISNASELTNRGAKYRSDLYFLNQTDEPAILIEVCFVDSSADCELYDAHFYDITRAIAKTLNYAIGPEAVDYQMLEGTMSTFGGPADQGVSPSEGLALCEPHEVGEFPDELFLDEQPPNTTGLARCLNPEYSPGYIACRWDYDITSRDWLQTHTVAVRNPRTGKTVEGVQPIDWGPHEEKTGRVADLSPGLAAELGLVTDDVCQVRVPIPARAA